jgi:phosphoribosylformimino-5-aminoimidazole carboxamide ribonucleotide (ProFAR) isomerase
MRAMKSSLQSLIVGEVDVDGTFAGIKMILQKPIMKGGKISR